MTLYLGSRKYCGTMVPERLKIMIHVIGNSILTFDLDFINFIKIPCKKYLFTAAPESVLFGAEYELSVDIIQAALNFYEGKIEVIKDGMDSQW